MAVNPGIGESGGQHYDIVRAIQTFLGQMAEGGISVAAAVIKELLQNADDAGATEVSVILDERTPPSSLPEDYRPLLSPAIVVRNNRPFRLKTEVGENETDDFAAICDVASGHKRAQATAAGRFGIGFNSVYFLSDTPILFSRREVHVFDLLHRVFEANGWRFRLSEFPATSGSLAGPAKGVVQWFFPKAVLGSCSFESIANSASGDFKEAVVRLPLRDSADGVVALQPDRFCGEAERERVLEEMAEQAAKAILFLKNVRSITFGKLSRDTVEPLHAVSASAAPPTFGAFLGSVAAQAEAGTPGKLACEFDRRVTWWNARTPEAAEWNFWVRHVADFSDQHLQGLRDRLNRNGERAIPWGAIAVPLDARSAQHEGNVPAWRVFLPLREAGPSACVFCGAFFVGPSRQHTEFRLVGSDEALRKTEWNKSLLDRVLIPLLVDGSAELPDRVPQLISEHPKLYLSLFPRARDATGSPATLADHYRQRFAEQPWTLRLFDIWEDRKSPVEWLVGDEEASPTIDMIPERLLKYRDRFHVLSTSTRRFVKWTVGDALRERVAKSSQAKIRREIAVDVARAILSHSLPPEAADLEDLLKRLTSPGGVTPEALDGVWTFARADNGEVLRYSKAGLYVIDGGEPDAAIHHHLRTLPLDFDQTEWVTQDAGLPMIPAERRREIPNVMCGDTDGALQLLSRVRNARHDELPHARLITPIIDFLTTVPAGRLVAADLKLGFLARTANHQQERRRFGVILLRPEQPSADEDAVWEALFRRTLAAVDPECARELFRLLRHQPTLISSLADEDCALRTATADSWLSILEGARTRCPDLAATLLEKLNQPAASASQSNDTRSTATAAVLREAVRCWDRLPPSQQETVLALPIHRTSSGAYVSLIGEDIGDAASLPERYRIQSTDDISDAPVNLSACSLLDSADPFAKQLYREHLRIDEHGRIAVLKEVLRQIGASGDRNLALLEYLGRYWHASVGRLAESRDAAEREDAADLEDLFRAARSVPCIDGEWRPVSACRDGRQVAQRIEAQGWERRYLRVLVPRLFPHLAVAAVDERSWKRLQRVHPELELLAPGDIANSAVTSESADLDLPTRLKLLLDNGKDVRGNPRPAPCVSQFKVPTIAGAERTLSQAVLCMPRKGALSADLMKKLVPDAVDCQALSSAIARQFRLPPDAAEGAGRQLPDLLTILGVSRLDDPGLRQRIVSSFSSVWPQLGEGLRLELLECVATYALTDDLKAAAATLETVRVCGAQGKAAPWMPPRTVICPSWTKTEPPCVPRNTCAHTSGVSGSVCQVWDSWCAINGFDSVAACVVDAAGKSGPAGHTKAARELSLWLDRVQEAGLVDRATFFRTLRGLPWVLASRSAAQEFQRPGEVLIHPGREILSHSFWVAGNNTPLPTSCSDAESQKALGFRTAFAASADVIEQLAHCLERSANADRAATLAVYRDVADLLEESEELQRCWGIIARVRPVFRLFREGQDRTVPALALFLGDNGSDRDFGDVLYCLRDGKPQGGSPPVSLFRRLQVPECPEPRQLLAAMSQLRGTVQSQRATYGALIDALLTSWSESTAPDARTVLQMRVATCAGTFSGLSECYWDDLFSDPSNVAEPCRPRVIDGTEDRTRRLVSHLLARAPEAVQRLAAVATPLLSPQPRPVEESPAIRELLEPWRTWLAELAAPDALLHEEAKHCGLRIPAGVMQILPVARIPLCFRLPQGDIIRLSDRWAGPVAVALDAARVFVRADCFTEDLVTDVPRLDSVDREIREQLAGVLVPREPQADGARDRALTFIKDTVERPAVVLDRLRVSIERHSFYQYYDQAADPEFVRLYDDYVRTKPGSPRHGTLAAELRTIVKAKFVTMRREQIRAYGYDEFSVFAELVQNAEDAYIQRQQLGLAAPPHWSVSFRFVKENGGMTLAIEHCGRPFNCWRHGTHKVEAFRKDVEGVLRSSGSFKPYGQEEARETQVIGRFGLGFKSVYLLTDCPAIFSGGWNFRIEAGCLPVAVARPTDLSAEATRISLPLRESPRALPGAGGPHALCLLPFLRQTQEISITLDDGCQGGAKVSGIENLAPDTVADGPVAELVTVAVSDSITSRPVRFIRVRSTKHFGQLAMLLASDGLPAPWSDGFTRTSGNGQSSTCDLYSALPLRSELGCGVALSHRFDVQSGRTHLVDSRENLERAEQVAELLGCLAEALQGTGLGNPIAERLLRFWGVWRWDRGDAETGVFRTRLAKQLALLSRQKRIVPTLDEAVAVSLQEQPLFSFSGIPQGVIDALVHAGFRIEAEGVPSHPVSRRNIVAPGFVRAFRRLAQLAPGQPSDWVDVGWDVIATVCRHFPWLATHPGILDAIAAGASEGMRDEISVWLAQCRIRGVCGGRQVHEVPRELVLDTGEVGKHLPLRLLALVDAHVYSPGSLELLRLAGLSDRPSSTSLRGIIGAKDLTTSEAVNVLRYLATGKRWRNYDDVQVQLRDAWFPVEQGRITVAAAVARSLIENDAIGEEEFKAWLGIGAGASPAPPQHPPIDARGVLLALHSWWQQHGCAWEREYERRTYPGGRAPQLSSSPDLTDLPQRKEWLSLLLLGACHTIGRARSEQHRSFLQMCQQNNWLDTFASRESSADDWMALLESYLDRPPGEIRYYQWAKLFVPIFHLSRWLDTYVNQARSMNRGERFRLQQIFAPRLDARGSGSGRDAPSGNRALGIGACFVSRELCRLGVVSSPYAHEHCYVPSGQVRSLIETIAGERLFAADEMSPQGSIVIFRFLRDTFGEGGEDLARFRAPGGATTERCGFDLPLLALCDDDCLRREILGRDVSIPDEGDTPTPGAADEGWRTLPDGRRIKLW